MTEQQLVGLPTGFLEHDGNECPVDPDSYVDLIIMTGETDEAGIRLLGHSGAVKAKMHEWRWAAHEDGHGIIVGYRPANRDEEIDVNARWPSELPPQNMRAPARRKGAKANVPT
jgi:hypothetical protein